MLGRAGAGAPGTTSNNWANAQAQVVLQGKSRSVIIRELQRTNLDVNLAVNNLLSRDDEDGEDGDDTASESYLPGGERGLSLKYSARLNIFIYFF